MLLVFSNCFHVISVVLSCDKSALHFGVLLPIRCICLSSPFDPIAGEVSASRLSPLSGGSSNRLATGVIARCAELVRRTKRHNEAKECRRASRTNAENDRFLVHQCHAMQEWNARRGPEVAATQPNPKIAKHSVRPKPSLQHPWGIFTICTALTTPNSGRAISPDDLHCRVILMRPRRSLHKPRSALGAPGAQGLNHKAPHELKRRRPHRSVADS